MQMAQSTVFYRLLDYVDYVKKKATFPSWVGGAVGTPAMAALFAVDWARFLTVARLRWIAQHLLVSISEGSGAASRYYTKAELLSRLGLHLGAAAAVLAFAYQYFYSA